MYEDIFLDVTSVLEGAGLRHGSGVFLGEWKDNRWMNTPGSIYCGETDNCGTGPPAAPNNVAVDEKGFEIIYRQPVNRYELRQVVDAAWADPWSGYGADGNLHWSYAAIKEWWADSRRKLEQELQRLYDVQLTLPNRTSAEYIGMLARWMDYLKDGMHQYLQVYAFFIDNGRVPTESDTLPEL